MKKDFIKELAELINKHSLEKEMGDTPDYILAQVCVGAMAVFSEAIARRDEWHGFRKADEKNAADAKRDDCNICKDRFKCADYMRTQSISSLIQRCKTTKDREEKAAIAGLTDKCRCVRGAGNGYSGGCERSCRGVGKGFGRMG